MRKQRRYEKRFEIEAEINRYRKKAREKTAASVEFEKVADEFIQKSREPGITDGFRERMMDLADEQRVKAQAARRSAERIDEIKIPMLGRTLAAFQTQTLPGMDDKGVVLQK